MTMTRSWYAVYRAKSGLLIGGVRGSRSSRFGSPEDAHLRLESALQINREAGNECDGEVHASHLDPEIFVHCGRHAQSIGGKCFECGKILTKDDAREAGDRACQSTK
jgi:hypothetical protein